VRPSYRPLCSSTVIVCLSRLQHGNQLETGQEPHDQAREEENEERCVVELARASSAVCMGVSWLLCSRRDRQDGHSGRKGGLFLPLLLRPDGDDGGGGGG
jgi:hypothetical protein